MGSAEAYRYDLSVVVAAADPRAPLERCLAALGRACAALRAEVLVVQAGELARAAVRTGDGPVVRVLTCEPGTLVPQLWARGLASARGAAVAFTLSNCIVSEGWAEAMLAGLRSGAAGVGGPLQVTPRAPAAGRAMFFLRYSAFLPGRFGDGVAEGEIPGDNAVYRRGELERDRGSMRDGFWEVEFHRRLRARGGTLRGASGAVATFEPAVPLLDAARQRFAHGRHFGAWRVRAGGRGAFGVIAASPLVPLVLASRVAARVMPIAAMRGRLLTAVPHLLVLTAAWAAGEAWGAIAGSGLPETTLDATERDTVTASPGGRVSDGSR